ncbi:hypothetical protein AL350_gp28 [Equine adenovirus 2]|uniref:Uncharacterized protein n=1 Tax=Equine adenovirus B serotype 2 TaxID=67603 RepID=A0A0K1DBW1_ADEE2|nr:hypothetical protein AL350_gp28 [Equine adenovirus 2]AKT26041.1 hypothetical protein [Equine adenovirus 2]
MKKGWLYLKTMFPLWSSSGFDAVIVEPVEASSWFWAFTNKPEPTFTATPFVETLKPPVLLTRTPTPSLLVANPAPVFKARASFLISIPSETVMCSPRSSLTSGLETLAAILPLAIVSPDPRAACSWSFVICNPSPTSTSILLFSSFNGFLAEREVSS